MFRCEECGSGYSMRAVSSWECCPRCLARDKTTVPLTFELGWRGTSRDEKRLPLRRLPLDRTAAEAAAVPEGDAA
jgi:hypothetical protein